MSFRISLEDILRLSGLAYTIGKALTTGRKLAPDEFQEVQNQLFAISNALKVLSTTLQENVSKYAEEAGRQEEDEILSQMVENCQSTLEHFNRVLQRYPELRPDSEEKLADESTRKRWRRELKENIKKIKWTTEGTGLGRLRQDLATHVNALNLAIAARSCLQTSTMNTNVDQIHEKLGDIHTWFLTNVKNVRKGAEGSRRVDVEIIKHNSERMAQHKKTALTFSLLLDPSSNLICHKAAFKADWLRTQGIRIFDCLCGKKHIDLDYTLLPVSLIVGITTTRPSWKMHAFSREHNSIVPLILTNIPTAYQAEFRQSVAQLALTQGLRSLVTGTSSMLMYTSTREDGRGSLSVLDTQCNTAGFKRDLRSITLSSNGLRYVVKTIESVQILHYMTVSFPERNQVTTQPESPELLPCRHGELVVHTEASDGDEESTITQLVLKLSHLTVIDEGEESVKVVLRAVGCKTFLEGDEYLDIPQADAEIAFNTIQAAVSCRTSLTAFQRSLFLSYLQFQRLDEIVQSRKYIGDVMIRDMQLLDAQASIIQDPTANEERMIINSKCGSKFVTVILPSASSPLLPSDGTEIAPILPAFFVDIGIEKISIARQDTGSPLRGSVFGELLR